MTLPVIVLSLQDAPYRLIQSGVKNVEFRRRWRQEPCVAYVYRSGKNKEISARMVLGAPLCGTAAQMAAVAEAMIAGNGPSIAAYFQDQDKGYAIPIERFETFTPIPLAALRQMGFHPPQFFAYLSRYPALEAALAARVGAFS